MRPHYNNAASDLKNMRIPVGAINGPLNPGLMQMFGVRGYPTQVTFHKGKQCKKIFVKERDYIVQLISVNHHQREEVCSGNFFGEHVKELTEEDFTRQLASYKGALVTFYAEWCSYCKKFAPELNEAARELKRSHPDILIAAVNVPENGSLGKKYFVKNFPTIKWFENGQDKVGYRAGRDT